MRFSAHTSRASSRVSTWPALGYLLLTASLLLTVPSPSHALSRISEVEVKAAFVTRFAAFASWPKGTLDESIEICVGGSHDMFQALAKLSQGRLIQERQVQVNYVTSPSQAEQCHVLFIAGSLSKKLPSFLRTLSEHPILTIGDTKGFAERGVMINMFRHGPNIRFEVNVGALKKRTIGMPAKVLRLARRINSN